MAADLPHKERGRRLKAGERAQAAGILRKRYDQGESIRQLSGASGYSIGLVRSLLLEAGVAFRPRGGRSAPRRSAS